MGLGKGRWQKWGRVYLSFLMVVVEGVYMHICASSVSSIFNAKAHLLSAALTHSLPWLLASHHHSSVAPRV